MKAIYRGVIIYIKELYNPSEIIVRDVKDSNMEFSDEVIIDVFFDEISDDYISNPNFFNLKKLKERNLELQIRNDVYNYFGVMTSGLSLQGFTPYKNHELKINVHSK